MDEPWENDDIIYLGKGKYILKPFKNIWFNTDGSEKNPLKVAKVPKQKIGTYTCPICSIRTDEPNCPICRRTLPKTKVPP